MSERVNVNPEEVEKLRTRSLEIARDIVSPIFNSQAGGSLPKEGHISTVYLSSEILRTLIHQAQRVKTLSIADKVKY